MSIRARLALWYGGIMAILLVIFGGALYGILRGSLITGADRTLDETAAEIQSSARRQISLTPFNWSEVVTLPPLDVFAASDVFVQARQLSGEIAAASANLRGRELPSLPDDSWRQVLAGQIDVRTVSVEGTRLRLRTESLFVGDRPAGVIQVAISLHSVDEALQRLLSLLLAIGGMGLLMALLGGAFLARQSLAPVVRVTETARRIAATEDLGERLPAPTVQDELGELVTTFNEMLDRLQRLFQSQQRFIADVSHELRTPLAAIRGNLEVLQRGAAADPELLNESLSDVSLEVARLSRMVTDLLVLARAEAGVHVEHRPVELDQLLLEVYREARHLSRGVEVRLGQEDQARIQGDADRLKQLLLNLVDNSLKYTPAGGVVTLSLGRQDSWACLSVSDTGGGINPDDLPHIFDRFYRGKDNHRRGGIGLGLSIAQWIVQEHGGEISVASGPAGSTFTVRLPLLEMNE